MKLRTRTITGLLFTILLMVMPFAHVSAQPSEMDTVFTSQLTGDDIDIGDGTELQFVPDQYAFNGNESFQEEYIWIWSTSASFELILVDGPTDAAEYTDITLGNMETYYDAWTLLDTEADATNAWFIGEGEIEGDVLIVYYEYEVDVFGDVDFAYMQFASDVDLIPNMQLSQDQITVGGLSVPLNADLETIADLLGLPTDDAESTPEDETTSTSTSRTSRTSRTTAVDSDDTEATVTTGTTSRTSRTTSVDEDDSNDSETSGNKGTRATTSSDTDDTGDTGLGEWSTLGLVDDAVWESPTHGSTVEWDLDLWEFPLDYESAIIVDPDGWDSLTLQTTNGLGYVFVTVDYTGDNTPRTLLDFWQSEDYLSGVGPDAVIIDSAQTRDSASIIYTTVNLADEPIMVILDGSIQDDGTVVYTQLTAAPDTIAEVYADYVDGVFYNGGTLNLTWDVEEIDELQP